MHGLENHVNDEITQGNRVNGKVYKAGGKSKMYK